jgi:hypothetical protein
MTRNKTSRKRTVKQRARDYAQREPKLDLKRFFADERGTSPQERTNAGLLIESGPPIWWVY